MTVLIELAAATGSWSDIKEALEHALDFSRDGIHVLIGPLIQVLVAAALRTSVKSPWPCLIVFGLALINEWYDFSVEAWPSFAEQLGEGIKDVLLTMLLPTLLLLTARIAPGLLVGVNGPYDDEGEKD